MVTLEQCKALDPVSTGFLTFERSASDIIVQMPHENIGPFIESPMMQDPLLIILLFSTILLAFISKQRSLLFNFLSLTVGMSGLFLLCSSILFPLFVEHGVLKKDYPLETHILSADAAHNNLSIYESIERATRDTKQYLPKIAIFESIYKSVLGSTEILVLQAKQTLLFTHRDYIRYLIVEDVPFDSETKPYIVNTRVKQQKSWIGVFIQHMNETAQYKTAVELSDTTILLSGGAQMVDNYLLRLNQISHLNQARFTLNVSLRANTLPNDTFRHLTLSKAPDRQLFLNTIEFVSSSLIAGDNYDIMAQQLQSLKNIIDSEDKHVINRLDCYRAFALVQKGIEAYDFELQKGSISDAERSYLLAQSLVYDEDVELKLAMLWVARSEENKKSNLLRTSISWLDKATKALEKIDDEHVFAEYINDLRCDRTILTTDLAIQLAEQKSYSQALTLLESNVHQCNNLSVSRYFTQASNNITLLYGKHLNALGRFTQAIEVFDQLSKQAEFASIARLHRFATMRLRNKFSQLKKLRLVIGEVPAFTGVNCAEPLENYSCQQIYLFNYGRVVGVYDSQDHSLELDTPHGTITARNGTLDRGYLSQVTIHKGNTSSTYEDANRDGYADYLTRFYEGQKYTERLSGFIQVGFGVLNKDTSIDWFGAPDFFVKGFINQHFIGRTETVLNSNRARFASGFNVNYRFGDQLSLSLHDSDDFVFFSREEKIGELTFNDLPKSGLYAVTNKTYIDVRVTDIDESSALKGLVKLPIGYLPSYDDLDSLGSLDAETLEIVADSFQADFQNEMASLAISIASPFAIVSRIRSLTTLQSIAADLVIHTAVHHQLTKKE